ncbi:protein kinase [Nocardia sp. NPDC020380]|uniref:protein kinase domain-containing protein n=1 Tax=Nocardia sp. NPDC020380 TaxID=3364309 RepID=UPI0037A8AA26
MGSTLSVGQIYAGYRIEGSLGEGGMGKVYLARDRNLNRSVALKLLTNAKVNADRDGELRLRFELEADLVARLQHPNIVTVYDCSGERTELALSHLPGTRHGCGRRPETL